MLFFTGMAACVKALAVHIPLYEMIFFRSGISALLLWILLRQRRIPVRATRMRLLLIRSLLGFIAMSCNFYALSHLPLGDAAILTNSFPIFVALLSFFLLDERPDRGLFLWITIALLGIALILKPQFNFFNYTGLLALLSSLLNGMVVIAIHISHETDPSPRIAFYFMAVCTLLATPPMLHHFVTPQGPEIWFLVGMGLFGAIGQILMTRAYGLEDVSRLAPLAYSGVIFSFLIGILFWEEIPTWSAGLGSLVVIVSCIRIAKREQEKPLAAGP